MKGRSFRHLLIVCAGFVLSLACVAQASAQERAHYPYRGAIHRGDWDRAEKELRELVGEGLIEGEQRWVLVVDLARIYRLNGDMKRAGDVLGQLPPEQAQQPFARLEAAIQKVGQEEEKAQNAGGAELVRLRHEADHRVKQGANYHIALRDFDRELYDNCVRRCDRIIRDIGQLKLYQHPDASDLRHLIVRARRLKDRAEAQLLILKHGEDYLHYREGRRAQARGDHEQAIEHYGQVEADILRDAAQCYTADCLLAMGHADEAARRYQRFIDADPDGLYRGEAMLKLARLQITHARSKSQLEAAGSLLVDTLAWHERVAKQAPPVTAASIQKVLDQFPPPDQFTTRDNFGNYHRTRVSPDTIVNRLTSTWYLQELEVQTTLLHGFALNELGQRDEGLAAFERTLELNDQYGGYILDLGSLPQRLLADARDGALLIPPAAWNALSREHGTRLHLAFLYLVINDTDAATPLIETVREATANTPGHEADRAAAAVGMACVHFENGKTDAALNELRRFDTQYAKTPLAPLAQIMVANILAGQRGDDAYREALQRYSAVGKGLSGTAFADRAWLSMAVAAHHRQDLDTADAAARRVASAGAYHGAAQTLRALIESTDSDSTAGRTARSSQSTGRVVPVSRHFVYPGALDLRTDMSRLNRADLLRYTIAFSIRSGCVIRNFRVPTTILEPQAPPTDESPLDFIRAASLLGGM